MNRKLALRAALVTGIVPVAAFGQVSPTPPAPATAAATAQKPVPPSAFPAKIALVAFDQCVLATNEGRHAVLDVQKKYEPQKTKINQEGAEIDSLKKQADALPQSAQQERADRLRTIDTKEKQYQLDVENAQNAYQADLQEAYGKVAQKVNAVLQKYVRDNGYTLLIDVSNQQSAVMWASASPNADITEAVVQAYNAATPNIAPVPPEAPSAEPSAPSPSTTPRTTPRSSAPTR